jgi:hypothetical protein
MLVSLFLIVRPDLFTSTLTLLMSLTVNNVVYTKSEETMYPVGGLFEFAPSKNNWMQWLLQDMEYMHPVLFGVLVVKTILTRNAMEEKTQYHLVKTLGVLKERLSDPVKALDDSTVIIVAALAIFFSSLGDYRSAAVHVRGLGDMIKLRGGLDSFKHSLRISAKLSRLVCLLDRCLVGSPCVSLDLAYALYSGQKPILSVSNEFPNYASSIFHDHSSLLAISDCPQPIQIPENQEIIDIYLSLQQICQHLNEGLANKLISAFELHDRITSIQYRLLNAQDSSGNVVTECLRLSMLAFILTMSMFQNPTSKAEYPYLTKRFQECYESIRASPHQCGDIILWALMIGAIVMFDVMDPWLHETWEAEVPAQLTWEEARRRLQNVLWNDKIHDGPGQQAFTALNLQKTPVYVVENLGDRPWGSSWAGCGYELLS